MEPMTLDEALNILADNEYELIKEGVFSKALATGALAAGLAFGNSGINSKSVAGDAVPNDDRGFGKTAVHLQQRYNYPSSRFGVPTSFELPDGETKFEISHKDEIEMTKRKILATPDTILRKYGKTHLTEIAELMVRTANKYNIDIDLMLAIAARESGYDSGAISLKKAIGIMQITDIAAKDSHRRLQKKDSSTYKFEDFYDLKTSIDNAGRILADFSKRRNNVIEMILASYNGGNAAATQWRYYAQGKKNKLPTETRNYVNDCIKFYKLYKKIQSDYIKEMKQKKKA